MVGDAKDTLSTAWYLKGPYTLNNFGVCPIVRTMAAVCYSDIQFAEFRQRTQAVVFEQFRI